MVSEIQKVSVQLGLQAYNRTIFLLQPYRLHNSEFLLQSLDELKQDLNVILSESQGLTASEVLDYKGPRITPQAKNLDEWVTLTLLSFYTFHEFDDNSLFQDKKTRLYREALFSNFLSSEFKVLQSEARMGLGISAHAGGMTSSHYDHKDWLLGIGSGKFFISFRRTSLQDFGLPFISIMTGDTFHDIRHFFNDLYTTYLDKRIRELIVKEQFSTNAIHELDQHISNIPLEVVESYGRWRVYFARNKILLAVHDNETLFSDRQDIFILRAKGDEHHASGFKDETFVFKNRVWALNNILDSSNQVVDAYTFNQKFRKQNPQYSKSDYDIEALRLTALTLMNDPISGRNGSFSSPHQ